MSDTNQSDASTPKKNILWVILSGAMAMTFIVMLFLPDSGMGTGMLNIYSAMLWCGIFGASLFRYLGRSGWFGFAAGSAAGMLIQILSQLV
ncbi:hypothetical protein [Alteromonas gilva]|uniref:Uncharacterized protein n=1 Tax=Alteromonas gilva TaxID=2987522 RepID=A0ABT5KWT5_9ALTE|nr:hypothetical protein [Alteromonas gilva]MDC8829220.1 hypothetical protein [Alteromonas gilva]